MINHLNKNNSNLVRQQHYDSVKAAEGHNSSLWWVSEVREVATVAQVFSVISHWRGETKTLCRIFEINVLDGQDTIQAAVSREAG